jgi:hypothetical protein
MGVKTAHTGWLLPDRPGLRQFWLMAQAFTLPLCGLAGPPQLLPWLIIYAVTTGFGLALAWFVVAGRQWLVARPVTAGLIFLAGLANLAHLDLLPRFEVSLRASAAARDLAAWSRQPGDALPEYDAGRTRQTFARGSGEVLAWTAQPLQRWTPIGWRDSCRMYLRTEGVVIEKAGVDHGQRRP